MSSPTAMSTRSAARIRREYLEFFEKRCGHAFVASSPVVPQEDPTLLFTNAGMNQFKPVFLGQETPAAKRIVNTQKCIRAGGKHNDLEDVGKDTYHHTFFEMLGNWSFGDYFKEDAIKWAWELLTEVWEVDPDRLYVTVFEGDEKDGTQADLEAETIWKKYLPEERISRWGKKDNFWEMGDTGPCGPCSEIHYDSRSDEERAAVDGATLVNMNHPDVIEIWNLVFIHFNRSSPSPSGRGQGEGDDGGTLSRLPAKHVDTGMGFERIVRVLQGKRSNYDTDVFTPIFEAIQEKTGAREYRGDFDDPIDIAYRVIADHVRCLTMAITDGAIPSNEGRGYVLRRILRRAVRHARQTFGMDEPVLCELVPAVIDTLGETFPELTKDPDRIAAVIREEEEGFLTTLDRGVERFESDVMESLTRAALKPDLVAKGAVVHPGYDKTEGWSIRIGDSSGAPLFAPSILIRDLTPEWINQYFAAPPQLPSRTAFQLHDTYGFPIDLTRVMAEERGMTVDEAGYERLMEEARERSRAGASADGEERITLSPEAIDSLKKMNIEPTEDSRKFDAAPTSSEIMAIWNGTDFDNSARVTDRAAIILDRTNFYAEQGGQVGDRGMIHVLPEGGQVGGWGRETHIPRGGARFSVEDTQVVGGYVLHIGIVKEGTFKVRDRVSIKVDADHRYPTRANHTGTHLLNHALRRVLGSSVEQKGSLVAPDRLRFDFSSPRALEAPEINGIERLVNAAIHQQMPVFDQVVPLSKAKEIRGVRAVFGEKYPDPVRVVSIGVEVDRLLAQPDNLHWEEFSIEFCGGTHLASTDDARKFIILQETALAAGVRRVVALTGPAALAADTAGKELCSRAFRARSASDEGLIEEFDALSRLRDEMSIGLVAKEELGRLLDGLRDRVRTIQKRAKGAARDTVIDQARVLAENIQGRIIVDRIMGADKDTLLNAIDVIRSRRPEAACMLFSADEETGKVAIAARVPDELIDQGLKAGDWVRIAAQVCGGGGGGRPDMAQAGGKDIERIDNAIDAAKERAEECLS